jgi:hypothetical protein
MTSVLCTSWANKTCARCVITIDKAIQLVDCVRRPATKIVNMKLDEMSSTDMYPAGSLKTTAPGADIFPHQTV